jgi:hypothetical protein
MMDKKLTLKLDKEVIDNAKSYARKRHQSLSKLVSNYFNYLSTVEEANGVDFSVLVRELSGVVDLEKGFDLDKEYLGYIVKKYK